jgi:hypothetical protein
MEGSSLSEGEEGIGRGIPHKERDSEREVQYPLRRLLSIGQVWSSPYIMWSISLAVRFGCEIGNEMSGSFFFVGIVVLG